MQACCEGTCCDQGNFFLIEYLLIQGANVNIENKNERNVLSYALKGHFYSL